MMRWAILAFLALASPAAAYWHSVQQVSVAGAASFTGPGDIVSGATAWYGLRGYSGAVAATGTQKSVNVRRQSDNTTSDILILTTGALDVAGAAAFAGIDATCQGTIASTTMTLTSCSSTPTANDTVTGTGIVGPSYIVSCGSFVAGAGSCTLNSAQTVSVAETITMMVGLFVTKWYDQSGNTRDMLQATAANQPQLLFNCIGSLACVSQLQTAAIKLAASASLTPATGVVSMSVVGFTTMTSGGAQFLEEDGLQNRIGASSIVNRWTVAGVSGNITTPNSAVTDSVWHAAEAVINGASSVLNVDGAETTGTVTGSVTAAAPAMLLGSATTLLEVTEAGVWDNVAFSAGTRTALQVNQKQFWGTP